MHRLIQDRLEQVLRETDGERVDNNPAAAHLAACEECRLEVSAMRRHAAMLRTLRAPEDLTPRPGFYARVMERIDAQRPIDIWQLFFDSAFARRIAIASMATALLLGVYLVSSERLASEPQPVTLSVALPDELTGDVPSAAARPGVVVSAGLPDKDAVLVNLVTYREQ